MSVQSDGGAPISDSRIDKGRTQMVCCAIAAYFMAQLGAALSLALATVFPGLRTRLAAEPVFSSSAWRPGMVDPEPARIALSANRRLVVALAGIVAVVSIGGLVHHGLHGHELQLVNGVPVLICSSDTQA